MIKRKLYPGSECLYIKIYSNACNLNGLLLKICSYLNSTDKIYCVPKFFFIRYADPEFHIRIRFFMDSPNLLPTMIRFINDIYKEELETSIIYKIQIDTYERELERYGNENIIESENIFFLESRFILNFMYLNEESISDSDIYVYLSIWLTDLYLKLWGYSIEEKKELLFRMSESFKKDFDINRLEQKQLNYIYHDYKRNIENILEQENFADEHWNKSCNLREKYKMALADAFKRIKFNSAEDKYYRTTSHIHMLNNRIFSVENRKFEMIIYDFLYRYYKSANIRCKTNSVLEYKHLKLNILGNYDYRNI